MFNKNKFFTVITFAALFLTVIEFLFFRKPASEFGFNKENLKNVPINIISTDSLGKKDTMEIKKFLKSTQK